MRGRGATIYEFLLLYVFISRGCGPGGVQISSRGLLAEARARWWEPGRRKQSDASIFRGSCFLGSGGRAFKQRVVPCVHPII